MDPLLLARIQFAFTASFHFIFPPLSIGMAWLIAVLMTAYVRTGDESYGRAARFWTKLFITTFAVGVATGIPLEFQFGTNWAAYSRFVGDIFGGPLAAEGIFAFFLESAFVGVLVFGWGRVSTRTLWFSSLMVAIGSTLSAFWIIVANSWQQTPAGYHVVGGRAELTSFFDAVFNPSTLPRYLHTLDGALATGALFMLGTSAWFLLRQRHVEFARMSMKISLVAAFAAAVMQLPLGHVHAVQVARTQPAKLAAIEGLFETQSRAPALIFGIPDAEAEKVHLALALPGALSLLAFGDAEREVQGLDAFPREEWPPILATFIPFHVMVGIGMYFIAFTSLGLLLLWRRKLFENRLFLKLAVVTVPLPFIANELGWATAELGRQPWIVQGLLRTADGISVTVPAWQVLLSLIAFVLTYAFLFAVWVFLMRRTIREGPETEPVAVEGGAES